MSRRAPGTRRRLAAAALTLVFASFLLVVWSFAADRPLFAALRPSSGSSAPQDDVSCFLYDDDADAVSTRGAATSSHDDFLDAASIRASESSIFFLETSCSGGGVDAMALTFRQACAVESAARMHPHRAVYLLMTGASRAGRRASRNGTRSRWPAAARALLAYANVRVAHLDVGRYARGTPLHAWFADGALASSKWPKEHASDALRYLTLWRFGGTYLDLDYVVTRSFDDLRNFAGAETEIAVGSSVLGFARDELGRRVASACLRELRTTYRGDIWGNNGPGVITRVLKRLCQVDQMTEMSEERCQGFRVLPPSAFYPVPYENWTAYFTEADAIAVINASKESYAVHLWNKASANAKLNLISQQPYAQFARQFCPSVVQSTGTVS